MTKFKVDVPEEAGGECARDAGGELARRKSLASAVSLLTRSHSLLQDADTQLFVLADFIAALGTGKISIEGYEDVGAKVVKEIRKSLLFAVVALDHPLLALHLEAQGVLGKHDGEGFARNCLLLVNRIREEYERWGIPAEEAVQIPEKVIELLRQAAEAMGSKKDG